MTNNAVATINDTPINLATKEQVALAYNRVVVMVPDAARMTKEQLTAIAQEAVLYRIMPGRDIHYFLNGPKLERVPDYKYLISFVQNRERLATNDPGLKITFEDKTLTDAEKLAEGVSVDDYAVRVTVSTNRDRDAYRREVAEWLKLGCNVDQAMTAAKKMMGESAGVSAVGVVKKADNNIPKGWTPIQKAKKLAIKAAIRLRWGEPTADELMAYVRQMRRISRDEADFDGVDLDLPPEAQARWADMNAQARAIQEESARMSHEDHAARLAGNPLARDLDDTPIGEEPEAPPLVVDPAPAAPPAVPADPIKLTELVNRRVLVTFDNARHAFNALKGDLDGFTAWPEKNDAAGWQRCYDALVAHARAKETN